MSYRIHGTLCDSHTIGDDDEPIMRAATSHRAEVARAHAAFLLYRNKMRAKIKRHLADR